MKLKDVIVSSNLTCDHCNEGLDRNDFARIQDRETGETLGITHWECWKIYVINLIK
jgi:hypothetical protein